MIRQVFQWIYICNLFLFNNKQYNIKYTSLKGYNEHLPIDAINSFHYIESVAEKI
jgi:hypothetical protein